MVKMLPHWHRRDWRVYVLRSAQYAERIYVGMEPKAKEGQRHEDHCERSIWLGKGEHKPESTHELRGDMFDVLHKEMEVFLVALD